MYILKSQNGFYKLRIKVNNNLIKHFGRVEITKSLKTKRLIEAKSRALGILEGYYDILTYSKLSLATSESIEALCNKYIANHLRTPNKPLKQYTKINYKQALESYTEYYNTKENTSKETKQAVLSFLNSTFIELIGAYSYVSDTDLNDLMKLKESLRKLPSKNYKQYKNKTTKELLKLDIPTEHKLSIGRLQSYIKYIKAFFRYCLATKIISFNPAQHLESVSSTNSPLDDRLAFSDAEVMQILNIADTLSTNKRIIYYTLAYTGMRLSELYKCDIKQDKGLYYFDLLHTKEQLKTKGSYRLIPLHSELLRINTQGLFKQAISSIARSTIIHEFSNTIKPLISNNDKKVLYSLRHSFATKLKHKGVNTLIISELMGHSHAGMTLGRYADRYPLSTLKGAIESLGYIRDTS